MIKPPVLPNAKITVSILERTTLRERIDTLLGGRWLAIHWHTVHRLTHLLETMGNAPIVLTQITIEDQPPQSRFDVTKAMGDTGAILWEYRKDNDKPAVSRLGILQTEVGIWVSADA